MKYPNLNIASIMTTMFEPSANYNKCTLWYGDINDFESSNFRGYGQKLDSDFHIEDPYFREVNF
jgi:hypothetical protein